MVIYFNQDLRARTRTNWLGRTLWRYEEADTVNGQRTWHPGQEMSQADFEKTLDGPPPKQGDRDFRQYPQEVGLCLR